MLRLDRDEERRLFAEAERQLARIGMADRMHELAGNLALGPQRLMEIARALCTDPALLLLDEPAAGLRHKEKQALADVLRQLKGEGMSLLLVEHDMEFVMGLTDRIVVMEFGTKPDGRHAGRSAGQPARCAPPTSGRSTDGRTCCSRSSRPARRLRPRRSADRPEPSNCRAARSSP
jgi:ABC-type polar amino acid transport system ATPase subunit